MLICHFDGEPGIIARAREEAARFLDDLERTRPTMLPEARGDVLMVVSELMTNSFCYAPGPLTLVLRDTGESVHVMVRDTSPTLPEPRPLNLSTGAGTGWHLVNALAMETYAVPESDGKSVHAFLPW